MRWIHGAVLDERRPVLVLTRTSMVGRVSAVAVAPISTTVLGLSTEVPVGTLNGLGRDSVVKCDQVTGITADHLLEPCGWFSEEQEPPRAGRPLDGGSSSGTTSRGRGVRARRPSSSSSTPTGGSGTGGALHVSPLRG